MLNTRAQFPEGVMGTSSNQSEAFNGFELPEKKNVLKRQIDFVLPVIFNLYLNVLRNQII